MPPAVDYEMMPFWRRKETPQPQERMLDPYELVQVDLSAPLAGVNEVQDKLHMQGSLVATVNAGGKDFWIVDTRETSSNRDFFIVSNEVFSDKKRGYKGVKEGRPVTIGRNYHADRFNYPGTVSREHFEVSYNDDKLFIQNARPTNSTKVRAYLALETEPRHEVGHYAVMDIRTDDVEDRIREHPNFGERDESAPYGYYLNHPVLGRASRSVEDGVYLGGSSREAIVVDGKSVALRQVYESVERTLQQSLPGEKTFSLQAVLLQVMDRVKDVMPYDAPKAEEINRQHPGDQLVGLSTYLDARAGVCRHQALLAAYIIENLIVDGYLNGAIGVERNTVVDLGGTHAWAVFKTMVNGREETIVVDPAQTFVGTKAQALREGRWEYRLSTDKY